MLTPRAATQAEIDHLVTMLASGVLSSSHNGKTTSFANADEIRKRIDYLQALTATTTEARRVTLIKRAG
jgi:hypothetical protein